MRRCGCGLRDRMIIGTRNGRKEAIVMVDGFAQK